MCPCCHAGRGEAIPVRSPPYHPDPPSLPRLSINGRYTLPQPTSERMENRKSKTGNVKPGELTHFLFSVFGFRFSIALSVGRFEKIDTLGKEGGPEASALHGHAEARCDGVVVPRFDLLKLLPEGLVDVVSALAAALSAVAAELPG